MRNWKKALAVAGTAAALAAVTACSGASSSGTDPVSTASGDPIRIGFVCSCSGPQSDALGATDEIALAWGKAINAKGGINGHPVEIVVKDDGLDPTRSLQAVKELVEVEKVVAIVGEASPVVDSWVNYVDAQGIPIVGGLSFSPPFQKSPNFFASGPSLAVQEYAVYKMAKEQGRTNLGFLYCGESPACKDSQVLAGKIADSFDLDFEAMQISANSPNFTAQCIQLKEQGADVLKILNTSPVQSRVMESCRQQGYQPATLSTAGGLSDDWLKDPNFDGRLTSSPAANYTDESIPAVKDYLDAVDQQLPNLRGTSQFSQPNSLVWVGFELFEAAAKAGNVGPTSTPDDVRKGLYALKDETLGGFSIPLNFTEGTPANIPCYFTFEVEGGELKSPDGPGYKCLSDDEVANLQRLNQPNT
ncbi:ABC transporter substrate-binding protein [Rhodococcus koreensis]